MDDTADPALQFFPDGKVDLYGALGVAKDASEDAIKKAYRKAALKYHPDKQRKSNGGADGGAAGTSAEGRAEAAASKFQQIGYAYAVLSAPARRTRYDTTGRTDESMFEEGMDWNAYFRELWTGEVNAETLEKFKGTYIGSKEERADILEAYRTTKGDLPGMVEHVPFMSLREDRARVEALVEEAIRAKEVSRSKKWNSTRKDTNLLAKAEQKEADEEQEAKEMARELGVYDALFGDKQKKAASNGSAKGKGKKRKGAEESGAGAPGAEEEDDVSALQNIIAKRNEGRGSQMNSLIAKLEAEAEAKRQKKGAGGKSSKGGAAAAKPKPPPPVLPMPGQDLLPGEPSEAEFQKARARMEARRTKQEKT